MIKDYIIKYPLDTLDTYALIINIHYKDPYDISLTSLKSFKQFFNLKIYQPFNIKS